MEDPIALIALCAPLAFLAVAAAGSRRPGRAPHLVFGMARFAGIVAAVTTAAAALLVALHGPLVTPTLGLGGLGFSLRLDALSVAMLALVSGLGVAVLRFSRNYLDGSDRHGRFMGLLSTTVACVMLLVLAGNVVQLSILWVLTSLALHRLLLFHPDRIGAVVAADKKWIVARLGDVCLLAAAVLVAAAFGTGDIGGILAAAAAGETAGVPVSILHASAGLVALSAALKSAQFPTHGWLAEVMETPTPVSALLHAGILNGGTFLIVRLGEVVLLSEPTLHALVLVGGFTSAFASVVMIAQSSVKVSLAYSSAAHMGFMLFLCGLGAFPVAILHLIAHSFYKAHAFLASGSAIELRQTSVLPRPAETPSVTRIVVALAAAIGGVLTVGSLLGASPTASPVTLGLSAVLAVGLTQLLARGLAGRPTRIVADGSLLAAGATTLAFFGLEQGAAALLAGSVPEAPTAGAATVVLMWTVVALYAAIVVVQLRLPVLSRSPVWAALWVHVRNGFYVNALFDRVVGAHVAAPRPLALHAHDRSPSA